MRWTWLAAVGALVVAGCNGTGPKGVAPSPIHPAKTNAPLIVVPSGSVRGKIVVVNPSARYVILSYPLGQPTPAPERRLAVFRNGLKVAEIKVDTRRIDTNVVADILTGDCQIGDEVRDE